MFVLAGGRGQEIFVDPASRLVMVHTAVRTEPRGSRSREKEVIAFWQGLVRELGTDRAP